MNRSFKPHHISEPLSRPEALEGQTYKVKWPDSEHALYITVNDLLLNGHRRPFEVFINSKNMEHFAWTVALTRMISAVFRRGGDVSFVVEELKAVFDPRGGAWVDGKYIPSILAAIGGVIEHTHMRRIGLIKDQALSSEHVAMMNEKRVQAENAADPEAESSQFPPGAQLCQKCLNTSMVMMDGCMTCLNCGDSKCG